MRKYDQFCCRTYPLNILPQMTWSFIYYCTVILSLAIPLSMMVEPWYHGQFCHAPPMLVNLDWSPQVYKNLSKNVGTNNHRFTYTPY